MLRKSKQIEVMKSGRTSEGTEERQKGTEAKRIGRPIIKAVRVKKKSERKLFISSKNDSIDSQRKKMDSSRT